MVLKENTEYYEEVPICFAPPPPLYTGEDDEKKLETINIAMADQIVNNQNNINDNANNVSNNQNRADVLNNVAIDIPVRDYEVTPRRRKKNINLDNTLLKTGCGISSFTIGIILILFTFIYGIGYPSIVYRLFEKNKNESPDLNYKHPDTSVIALHFVFYIILLLFSAMLVWMSLNKYSKVALPLTITTSILVAIFWITYSAVGATTDIYKGLNVIVSKEESNKIIQKMINSPPFLKYYYETYHYEEVTTTTTDSDGNTTTTTTYEKVVTHRYSEFPTILKWEDITEPLNFKEEASYCRVKSYDNVIWDARSLQKIKGDRARLQNTCNRLDDYCDVYITDGVNYMERNFFIKSDNPDVILDPVTGNLHAAFWGAMTYSYFVSAYAPVAELYITKSASLFAD